MKTYETQNQVGKEANDVALKLENAVEALLGEARLALMSGEPGGRKRIVQATLRLERLLGEVLA